MRAGVEWDVVAGWGRFTPGTGEKVDCIMDNLTSLMWVRDREDLPDYRMTWQEAMDYVASLNSSGGLCGYTDWRLPNRKELSSLINYGQSDPVAWLNFYGFYNILQNAYWSSTTDVNDPNNAWLVNLGMGVYDYDKRV